jgi:hypothetical protein
MKQNFNNADVKSVFTCAGNPSMQYCILNLPMFQAITDFLKLRLISIPKFHILLTPSLMQWKDHSCHLRSVTGTKLWTMHINVGLQNAVCVTDMKALNEHQNQHKSCKNIHKGNTVEPPLSGLRLTIPFCFEQSLKKREISASFIRNGQWRTQFFQVPIVGMTFLVWLCGSPGKNCIQMWWGMPWFFIIRPTATGH